MSLIRTVMQQVREVMTVNLKMIEESSWISLLVERRSRWGFRYVQNLRIRITVKSERCQMPSLWKILQGKKHPRTPWHGWECRTYTMLLFSSTAPTNSHTPWHMEGTDVLNTEILFWTEQCLGTPMAFSFSSKPRSPCGMGIVQDLGIHGAAWDSPTRVEQE